MIILANLTTRLRGENYSPLLELENGEAMKPSNEVEMLAIKVRMLESDVRELKSKIS